MTNLELKGRIVEMIATVNNEDILQDIYNLTAEIITQKGNLTKEQEAALEKNIALSYQSENLIDHKKVLQRMEKWGNK